MLYETVPPRAGTSVERMRDIASRFAERIRRVDIDAINTPEIRDEPSRTQEPRPFPFLPITPPREYGRLLATLTGKEAIINQVVVHYERDSYMTWLRETWDEYGVRTLVLVGGDSSRTAYRGPSVLEAAALIQGSAFEFLLGGITIPERHKRRGDEAARNLQKIWAGLRFFTSQVIYDPDVVVGLLGDYVRECTEYGVAPARILLSFALFSTEGGAEFLRWLGVSIPAHTLSTILGSSRPGPGVGGDVPREPQTHSRRRPLPPLEHPLRDQRGERVEAQGRYRNVPRDGRNALGTTARGASVSTPDG